LLNKKELLKNLFILFILAFSAEATAANKYWVATNNGTEKLWSDSANWTGGNGNAPGKRDVANFDSSRSIASVKLTQDVRVKFLKVRNGYSGTINLNGHDLITGNKMELWGGPTVLIPTGSLLRAYNDLAIGSNTTVTASGSGRIIVKSNLQIYGTLTAPSSQGSFVVQGGYNLHSGGTFNHNNGTVTLTTRYKKTSARIYIQDGPGTGRNFYNLSKKFKQGIYLHNHIEIENDLLIWGKGYIRAKNSSNTSFNITVGGDIDFQKSTNFQANSGKVILNGSSAQTVDSPASFKHLQISNSEVSLQRPATVTGTLTIDSGATLDINGKNLTVGTLANNGNLQLKGSETLSITTKDTNSGTITYDGTATGLAYGNAYYNLALNTSGTMTMI
jgi:hypothetical protein